MNVEPKIVIPSINIDRNDKNSYELKEYPITEIIRKTKGALVYISNKNVVKIALNQDTNALIFGENYIHQKMSHPTIIEYIDGGKTEKGASFIVTKKASGDLFSYFTLNLKYHFKTDLTILRIMVQISSALAYIHESGFIHCDLDPENILYNECKETGDIHVFICDFGLSVPENTIAGQRGKPIWRARETIMTKKSDVYSLGKILHYLTIKRAEHIIRSSSLNNVFKETVKQFTKIKPDERPTAREAFYTLKEILDDELKRA